MTDERVQSVQKRRSERLAFWVLAALFWAIPLLMGLGTFTLWLATRDFVLEAVGMYVLLGGLPWTAIGLYALASYCRQPRAFTPTDRGRIQILHRLILSNPVVGVGVAALGFYLMGDYVVVVRNDSCSALREIALSGPGGFSQTLPDVPPGGRTRVSFQVDGEGEVRAKLRVGKVAKEGVVIGYTGGSAEKVTLMVTRAGSVVTLDANGHEEWWNRLDIWTRPRMHDNLTPCPVSLGATSGG